jgi:beta-lactamase regulating signal transducer with metallopeptidase domain
MTAWLLTWLWQGLALTAVVTAALRCMPRLNAATKHLIWCGALAALSWLGWASAPYGGLTPVPVRGSDPIYVPSAPDIFITIFVGIWTSIALVNLLRLLPGLHALYALRDRCRPFPREIEAGLPLWLEAKASGRRTDLMICDEVSGATVLGLQRPCIALPSSLVAALTIDELDQVIIHEHAHVQRRDDWTRLAQTLLMSVLWIHPAALFVSRALNREREVACDDWVVAETGLPKAYARCLAHAAEARGRAKGCPTLVSTLVGRRHELVRRVDRLLAFKGKARRKVSLVRATAAAFAIAVTSAQLTGVRFAEIADIVLPQVPRPMIAAYDEATLTLGQFPVRLKPDTTNVTVAVARIAPTFASQLLPDATAGKPHAPSARNAPSALNAPSAPSYASSVAFPGVYSVPGAPNAPVASSGDSPNRWSALGAPGVEVASAAKRTSIGIANVFSRAGVSLARSF